MVIGGSQTSRVEMGNQSRPQTQAALSLSSSLASLTTTLSSSSWFSSPHPVPFSPSPFLLPRRPTSTSLTASSRASSFGLGGKINDNKSKSSGHERNRRDVLVDAAHRHVISNRSSGNSRKSRSGSLSFSMSERSLHHHQHHHQQQQQQQQQQPFKTKKKNIPRVMKSTLAFVGCPLHEYHARKDALRFKYLKISNHSLHPTTFPQEIDPQEEKDLKRVFQTLADFKLRIEFLNQSKALETLKSRQTISKRMGRLWPSQEKTAALKTSPKKPQENQVFMKPKEGETEKEQTMKIEEESTNDENEVKKAKTEYNDQSFDDRHGDGANESVDGSMDQATPTTIASTFLTSSEDVDSETAGLTIDLMLHADRDFTSPLDLKKDVISLDLFQTQQLQLQLQLHSPEVTGTRAGRNKEEHANTSQKNDLVELNETQQKNDLFPIMSSTCYQEGENAKVDDSRVRVLTESDGSNAVALRMEKEKDKEEEVEVEEEEVTSLLALEKEVDKLRLEIETAEESVGKRCITPNNLHEALKFMGMHVSKKHVDAMIWEVDDDLDGGVSWEELYLLYQRHLMGKLFVEPKSFLIVVQFMMADRDQSGSISVEEALTPLYHKYGRDQLDCHLKLLFGDDLKTQDGNGELSLVEFFRIMTLNINTIGF